MDKSSPITTGEPAPDFVLKDQNKEVFHLAEMAGQRVLLSFHPLAWTSVCAEQMKALDRNQNTFLELETCAVGLSVDSIPTKLAWAKSLGLRTTRLLSDFWPHGETADKYELFRNKEGFSQRANVIIGPDGKVEFVKIYDIPELPDIEEILSFLKKKS